MSDVEGKTSMDLDPKVAGLLCYALWWITGIIFFILEKENQFVRFHAMQSILTFAAFTIVGIILSVIPVVGWILGPIWWVISVIVWIIMMLKAYQGERYKLPVVGDIAEKQIQNK
jgi:uncharacterized membrane protein